MEHAGVAPFRIGATSYVIPGDLVTNARHLADRVDDMELVLFDVVNGPSNLPSAREINELAAIGRGERLTYTVHLPADLPAQPYGVPLHPILVQAQRLIETIEALTPYAYVFHLDGRDVRSADIPVLDLQRWQGEARHTLDLLRSWVGDDQRLALENVEGYDLGFYDPVLGSLARCVDVGHLWVDGHEATAYLRRWLDRTRVVHLHGLAERDHVSLAHLSAHQLDPVLELLLADRFQGVITLEVFESDFASSFAVLDAALARITAEQNAIVQRGDS